MSSMQAILKIFKTWPAVSTYLNFFFVCGMEKLYIMKAWSLQLSPYRNYAPYIS